MEILDEYSLYCGEEKHMKSYSQIEKPLKHSFLEKGETQNQILGKPDNLFESVALIQELEP
jgi:hypothetical protein